MTVTLPTPGAHAGAVTEPGIYQMTAARYHADPVAGGSLSSHEARLLLACPALYRHRRAHPDITTSPERDEGTVAHLEVLGAGAQVVVVDAPDWRTKPAQDARIAARLAGKTPILAHRHAAIRGGQVAALRRHRLAAALLTGGRPEQVLVWCDTETGVWCRAMLDYLHPQWVVDYKSAESVAPGAVRRAVDSYGYHIQAEWYRAGAAALGLGDLPLYLVFQEKTSPWLVVVARLDADFAAAGVAAGRRAREMYRDCTAAAAWPAYAADDEIVTIAAPRWLATYPEEYL